MFQQIVLISCTIFLVFSHVSSATYSLVYDWCSQSHYTAGSDYEMNLDSMLTAIVNDASFYRFSHSKMYVPGPIETSVVYGLFQCSGDLKASHCKACVNESVTRLGDTCHYATGKAIQLDGCYVKFDSLPFFDVEDKRMAFKKCGPSIGPNLHHRDAVLTNLTAGYGEYFRASRSGGSVHGVAQCMQDLSVNDCEDCLVEAIALLKLECGASASADMYLAKCYVRYSESGFHDDDDKRDGGKKLAIIIGFIIAGVVVSIVILFFFSRFYTRTGQQG